MNLLGSVEVAGFLLCITAGVIAWFQAPRTMKVPRALLVALLSFTALIHLLEYFEWSGAEWLSPLSETLMVLSPVLWGALFLALGRDMIFEQLHVQQQQMRLILETVPVELAIFDAQFRYLACSRAYRKLHFSQPDVRLTGRPAGAGERGFAPLLLEILEQTRASGGSHNAETPEPIVKGDAREWLLWSSSSWNNRDGSLGGFVVLTEPVTDSLRSEDELRSLQESLQHDNRLELVGLIASGIAHDLRNFLQIVGAHFELVRDGGASATDHQDSVHDTEQALRASTELLHSLSELSGRKTRPLQRVDLGSLVSSSRRLLARSLPPTVRLEVKMPEEILPVRGDPIKLQQVLLNLVLNARDASDEGGRIWVEGRTLEERGRSYIELLVADDGCGIANDVQARIFEHLFTTKDVGKGTGLGLAIVKSIVEEHAGTISVSSEPGKGSKFLIRFPRSQNDAGSRQPKLGN